MKAVCAVCTGDAAFYYKNDPSLGNGHSDLIGGSDKYTATCRSCYRARLDLQAFQVTDALNNAAVPLPGARPKTKRAKTQETASPRVPQPAVPLPSVSSSSSAQTAEDFILDFETEDEAFYEQLHDAIHTENMAMGQERQSQP